jgi:anti-anti-sigma regulatory factor
VCAPRSECIRRAGAVQSRRDSAEGTVMGIMLRRAKQASRLRLEGAIDISAAAELKAALLDAVAAGKTIRVSPEAVSELDVTAFQLLWAAQREAKQRGMKFIYAGEMPPPVKSAVSDLGLGLEACASSD